MPGSPNELSRFNDNFKHVQIKTISALKLHAHMNFHVLNYLGMSFNSRATTICKNRAVLDYVTNVYAI